MQKIKNNTKYFSCLFAIVSLLLATSNLFAETVTINFDDLTPGYWNGEGHEFITFFPFDSGEYTGDSHSPNSSAPYSLTSSMYGDSLLIVAWDDYDYSGGIGMQFDPGIAVDFVSFYILQYAYTEPSSVALYAEDGSLIDMIDIPSTTSYLLEYSSSTPIHEVKFLPGFAAYTIDDVSFEYQVVNSVMINFDDLTPGVWDGEGYDYVQFYPFDSGQYTGDSHSPHSSAPYSLTSSRYGDSLLIVAWDDYDYSGGIRASFDTDVNFVSFHILQYAYLEPSAVVLYDYYGNRIDSVGIPASEDYLFEYSSSIPIREVEFYPGFAAYTIDDFYFEIIRTSFNCEVTSYTPIIPNIDGQLIWDMTVTNTGMTSAPVHGEIYPTIGDCATGTRIESFDIHREITPNLEPGESYTAYYYYNTPDVNGITLASLVCAVGPGYNNYIAEDCFEFQFAYPFGRDGGNAQWNNPGEWLDREDNDVLPSATSLASNYPNPFNANTTISFELAEGENISIDVYNLAGQLVETIADGYHTAGSHKANWDASNYSSGVYFYKLSTSEEVITKRMTLLK
ncbi:MAG: T9SS type A sorting domain-containing protein [candidate division Zixibacteria bacterium]|nr:T9SS type A sorting domain-containing protein [candidate division Zixibacteria bacterium]